MFENLLYILNMRQNIFIKFINDIHNQYNHLSTQNYLINESERLL